MGRNRFRLALFFIMYCYFLPDISFAASSFNYFPPPSLPEPDVSTTGIDKKYSVKKYKEDELLVKFRSGLTKAHRNKLHNKLGSKKIKEIKKLNIDHIKLKKGLSVEEAIKQYKKDPSVEYAEPNYIVTAHIIPDDPYYSSYGSWGQSYYDMWGLNKIDAQNAWDVTQGGSDIIVAVSDTGLDFSHPDIQGKIWVNTGEIPANGIDDDGNGYIDDVNGWNFVYDSPSPVDDHGHGTHVSGTIAAATNNGQGISGISWLSKIMPVKFLGAGGWGDIADGADSIIYAADNGAKVINCSWGGTGYSQTLEDAINYAYNKGIVVVVSAGNDWELAEFFHPAGAENVLTVAATDYLDNKALFSNSGDAVEVAAPGVDILSLRADGTDMRGDGSYTVGIDYLRADGTSMAAPHVSGLAALLFAHNPLWSNRQVMGQIIGTTDDIGLPDIGTGRINAYSALTETALTRHIRYLGHTVDDSSGNNDGVIDANETITMIVDIRNLAAPVNGVTATLSTQDPYVTISDGTSDIGSMAAWSKADNSTDPFVFFASSQFPSHHKIVFILHITANNGNYSIYKVIEETGAPYLPGWPVVTHGRAEANAALADIDNDGLDEVVIVTDKLYVLNGDGTTVPGWPQEVDSLDFGDSPAVGDLDGDGSMEIVLSGINKIYAWGADGTVMPGFPLIYGISDYFTDVSLADLDLDGDLEIISMVMSYEGGPPCVGKLYVWHHDGSPLSGWPNTLASCGYLAFPHKAIGNIDNDDYPEIIIPAAHQLYAWNHDGTLVSGWPVTLFHPGFIALGDIDNDGISEVFVGAAQGHIEVTGLYGDGEVVPGWPQDGAVPSIGDVNGDGFAEIVALQIDMVNGHQVVVYRSDGTIIPSNTRRTTYSNSGTAPALGDIDGDGTIDIALRTFEHKIYAWHLDGTPLPDFPIDVGPTGTGTPSDSAATLGDINGDGIVDLMTGSGYDTNVYAFHLPEAYDAENLLWPMDNHDSSRSANADKLILASSQLPYGIGEGPYNHMLTSTGGVGFLTWNIVSGSLPPGLILDTATGEISGIPTTTGTYSFVVRVYDSASASDIKTFSITVSGYCPNLPVKIGGDYYTTLREAYIAAVDDAVIESQAMVFNEDLLLDRDISVSLLGGKDCYYNPINPFAATVLNGKLTIRNGGVIVENIVIQSQP